MARENLKPSAPITLSLPRALLFSKEDISVDRVRKLAWRPEPGLNHAKLSGLVCFDDAGNFELQIKEPSEIPEFDRVVQRSSQRWSFAPSRHFPHGQSFCFAVQFGEGNPVWKSCFLQYRSAAVDPCCAMSSPRNFYPDTTLYVTVRCVHRSYRIVPKKNESRVIRFAFAAVSSRYRGKFGMEFYEFEFLSTHYRTVLSESARAPRSHERVSRPGRPAARRGSLPGLRPEHSQVIPSKHSDHDALRVQFVVSPAAP